MNSDIRTSPSYLLFKKRTLEFIRPHLNGCFNLLLVQISSNISWFSERSHRRCSVKKDVLKNFAKLTGKHLCCSLILTKLQAFGPTTLLKRDSNTGVFLWNFCEIFKNTYLKNICERLLLILQVRYPTAKKLIKTERTISSTAQILFMTGKLSCKILKILTPISCLLTRTCLLLYLSITTEVWLTMVWSLSSMIPPSHPSNDW